MIKYYTIENKKLAEHTGLPDKAEDLVWVDMLSPSDAEEHEVEALLQIDAPTPEEMQEIEVSSRLYSENGALYITATLIINVDSDAPESKSVTFIIRGKTLITLRYSEPKAFSMYLSRVTRGSNDKYEDGFHVFLGLMKAVIDRLSDTLELVGRELDETSRAVFQSPAKGKEQTHDLQELLKKIGRMGDLNGKARESLLSLSRVFSYLSLSAQEEHKLKHGDVVATFTKDIGSLTDHATYLSNKVNLLLDATLGLINIEQNAIIKIFSVAAVVFLPPTLIASIYGMNFEHMPELEWLLGYPFAVGLMILSAILPYLYFKKKKWL